MSIRKQQVAAAVMAEFDSAMNMRWLGIVDTVHSTAAFLAVCQKQRPRYILVQFGAEIQRFKTGGCIRVSPIRFSIGKNITVNTEISITGIQVWPARTAKNLCRMRRWNLFNAPGANINLRVVAQIRQQIMIPVFSDNLLQRMRERLSVVITIHADQHTILLQIAEAGRTLRCLPGLAQSRQQHRGQNGDDGYDDQQLDESKALPDMTLGGWQRAIA